METISNKLDRCRAKLYTVPRELANLQFALTNDAELAEA